MLDSELRFLSSCSRITVDETAARNILDASGKSFNWDKLLLLSLWHGTAPLVYRAIISSVTLKNLVPDEIVEKLKNYYYASLARNLKLWKEFSEIEGSFRGRRIRIIPLKGIILGNTLYHNPALRCIMADIDLLVLKQDVDAGCTAMKGLGYRQTPYQPGHIYVFKKDSLMVEMHWQFLPPALSKISMETIWKNTQETVIDDHSITVLSWEDTLLTLSLQVRHDWPLTKLFRLSDINEIISQHGKELDWEYVVSKAKEWRLWGSLAFSLYWCRDFFSADLDKPQIQPLSFGYLKNKFFSYFFRKHMLLLLDGENSALRKTKWYGRLIKLLIFIHPADYFKILIGTGKRKLRRFFLQKLYKN